MSRRESFRRLGERLGVSRARVAARRAMTMARRAVVAAAHRVVAAARRAVAAARSSWATVRPTTRRGAVIGIVAVAGGSALLAGVFLIGAAMAWSPYLTSVIHPDADARAWAAHEPIITAPGACTGCHQLEAARAASARHAGIGCESCHGNLRDHILSSPTPTLDAPGRDVVDDGAVADAVGAGPGGGLDLATDATRPAVPTDAVCVRCHAATSGKPAALLQITPGDHYVLQCLQCHDPHTGISHRPPVVLHPLTGLPPCITCHGPEGFKARSERHPVVAGDEPCLACHGPGRGPEPEPDR